MPKAEARIHSGKGLLPHPAKALRKKAQALLGARASVRPEVLGPEATERLLHELHMHQLELELQNIELKHAQAELETSQKRYADLYEHAPVGYLTLSRLGLILDANLTSAMLLGLSRRELHRQPLARFILPADQDAFAFHQVRRFQIGASSACELRLLRMGSPPFWARLEASSVSHGPGDAGVCRVVISAIAEPRLPDPAGGVCLAGAAAQELNTLLESILSETCALKAASGPASAACGQLDRIMVACAKGRGVLKS